MASGWFGAAENKATGRRCFSSTHPRSTSLPYRILVSLSAAFWLVMTGLLVQLELNPQRSEMLSVPPAYVVGLMFLHGEESTLRVFDRDQPAGHLTLHPMAIAGEKRRVLEFSGSVSMKLTSATRQRFGFNGRVELDPALRLRRLQFELNLREPPLRAQFSMDDAQHLRYEINQSGEVIRGELNGLASAELSAGIDTAAVRTFQENLASVTVAARRTEFKVRDEKTSAYLLTVNYGTTVLAEVYVNELGQILLAKTAGGYNFRADDEAR